MVSGHARAIDITDLRSTAATSSHGRAAGRMVEGSLRQAMHARDPETLALASRKPRHTHGCMPARSPPASASERATDVDVRVVRRVPLAMSVALEVVAEMRGRRRFAGSAEEARGASTKRQERDEDSEGESPYVEELTRSR